MSETESVWVICVRRRLCVEGETVSETESVWVICVCRWLCVEGETVSETESVCGLRLQVAVC